MTLEMTDKLIKIEREAIKTYREEGADKFVEYMFDALKDEDFKNVMFLEARKLGKKLRLYYMLQDAMFGINEIGFNLRNYEYGK
jgi:hypothetical protein